MKWKELDLQTRAVHAGDPHPRIQGALTIPIFQSTVFEHHVEEGSYHDVLYPRLKKERSPQISPLADGKGVKLATQASTDYVFLDPTDFSFSQGSIAFKGNVGVIKVRGGKNVKSQPGSCDVAPGWEGGNRELRMIPWKGPQYPSFPYK